MFYKTSVIVMHNSRAMIHWINEVGTMYMKPRRQVLAHRGDRLLVHVGLLIVCGMLSILGLGVTAMLCFPPAAMLVEVLSLISPTRNSRRM